MGDTAPTAARRWMGSVTKVIDAIRDCKAETRDLIWNMFDCFQDAVRTLRASRGDQAAEAFLQLVRNMDDACVFSLKEAGEDVERVD